LFPQDLAAQSEKLVVMLVQLLNALDRPQELARPLSELGRRHRGYGATFPHYLIVGEALIESLAEVNDQFFDAEARLAWARLYSWVVYCMHHSDGESVGAAEASSTPDAMAA
jgi:nitric oxide dioxygenase